MSISKLEYKIDDYIEKNLEEYGSLSDLNSAPWANGSASR